MALELKNKGSSSINLSIYYGNFKSQRQVCLVKTNRNLFLFSLRSNAASEKAPCLRKEPLSIVLNRLWIKGSWKWESEKQLNLPEAVYRDNVQEGMAGWESHPAV